MKTFQNIFVKTVSYFFILLFIYASVSKLLDFENFQVQIAQSPLLSAYAGFISYAVIIVEIIIVLILIYPKTQILGLYLSTALMTEFTVYIYLILNYSDFVPCSCGGILEKLGWTEHLIFNIICVILGIITILWLKSKDKIKLRQTILVLCASNTLSILVVVILFLSSEHIIKKENNFTRRFTHHPIIEEQSIDLKVNSYYFAGSDYNHIYLANLTSPFRIFKIEKSLKKVDTISITPSTKNSFRKLKYSIQNNSLFAYDGSVPVIYRSSLDSLNYPIKQISYRDIYFNHLKPASRTSFFFSTDNSKRETLIGTLSTKNVHQSKMSNFSLNTKKDGGFDSDGKLLYDGSTGKAYYMFYYRNQILDIDSNLQVNSHMKTIDTITKAKINIKTLRDGTKKMISPPIIVNQNMEIYRGLIFNISNLKGKHESNDLWNKNSIVDIYTTKPAGYWGSIYVENRGKNRLSQILITDNFFYILSGTELRSYRFAQAITKQFNKGESRKPL
ncbi:MauE/DoxX family redox-associated membrane protein [Epilithonimonas sp.]|uniref:MauE/DoxX family redox-associated membrane protein n=1 Tax=Epilithonimonas sp. TaxID=2894511 RepID=UPI002FDD4C70